jgi:2'-5' RNA ligase
METIRAFIAIDLPAGVKQALGKVIEELSAQAPRGSVRWVKPGQMHLTLCFLGDTALAKLPDVQKALDHVIGRYRPFTLHLGRTGCFPNCRQPRVIWVGLEEQAVGRLRHLGYLGASPETQAEGLELGDSMLARLKRELDKVLRPLGWEPEKRPFHPHLTLGRVKDNNQVRGLSWTVTVPPLAIPVTAVYLIQSDLRPDGPIYTIRHTSRLDKITG